jgi:hypothetical protein
MTDTNEKILQLENRIKDMMNKMNTRVLSSMSYEQFKKDEPGIKKNFREITRMIDALHYTQTEHFQSNALASENAIKALDKEIVRYIKLS